MVTLFLCLILINYFCFKINTMKKLIYLFLGLLIVACSSDDNQLFLEKYDSVVWETIDDGERLAFVNGSKTLAVFYDACFIYELEGSTETQVGDTVTISIQDETENSISLLVQSTLFPEDKGLFTFTVTSDGSTYTLSTRFPPPSE